MIHRDEIISMAREAEIGDSHGLFIKYEIEHLERFAELATAKERTAHIEAQQRLADMQELAAKSGLAHRKAEPVAWMWRVADSDWQLESTCPPERPLAIVEPLYTGYMADAYIGAREEVEIWKRRALEAEKKLQAEIARLTAENEAVQDAVSDAVAAEREACAELMEQQHTWITNVAASALIRARGTP